MYQTVLCFETIKNIVEKVSFIFLLCPSTRHANIESNASRKICDTIALPEAPFCSWYMFPSSRSVSFLPTFLLFQDLISTDLFVCHPLRLTKLADNCFLLASEHSAVRKSMEMRICSTQPKKCPRNMVRL